MTNATLRYSSCVAANAASPFTKTLPYRVGISSALQRHRRIEHTALGTTILPAPSSDLERSS